MQQINGLNSSPTRKKKQFEQIMKDCQPKTPVKLPAHIRFQGVSESMRPSDTQSVTSSEACMQTEETCLVVEIQLNRNQRTGLHYNQTDKLTTFPDTCSLLPPTAHLHLVFFLFSVCSCLLQQDNKETGFV